MANKERGEVTLTIESETYTLRLDLNALCEVESVMSTPDRMVSWQQAITMAEKNSLTALRAIMWAALRAHHPGVSMQDAGTLIQRAGGIGVVVQTLADSITAALPPKASADDKRPIKARSGGRGERSSSGPEASGSSVRNFGT